MTRLLKPLLPLLALLWLLPLQAQQKQTFTVTFGQDPRDATAQNPKHERRDGDGQRYAIVKVRSTSPDDDLSAYQFNFGYPKHIVTTHDDELWVYVQRNAKWVTVSRQGYATVSKYDLGTTIQSGYTYLMQLSPTAAPILTQMVQFSVVPVDAQAAISVCSEKEGAQEEFWGNVDETGAIARSLPLGTYTYKVLSTHYHPSEGRLMLTKANKTHVEKVTLRPNFAEMTLRAATPETEIFVNGQPRGRGSWTGRMKAGNYQLETRLDRHKPATVALTVREQEPRTVDLPAPTPITGTLAITSRPLGARILIDGQDRDMTTPIQIPDVPIGQHKVTFLFSGNRSRTIDATVKEKETTQVEGLLANAMNEDTNKKQKAKPTTPPKQETENLFASTGGYVMVAAQVGKLMGVGGGLGCYLYNVNLEVSYMAGLAKSEDIFWSDGTQSIQCNYKSSLLGVRLGYGIPLGRSFRLTPQMGCNIVNISSEGSKGYAAAATVGLRAEIALAQNISLFAAPEASFTLQKSDIYKEVAYLSTKINGWINGFNARVGVSVNF